MLKKIIPTLYVLVMIVLITSTQSAHAYTPSTETFGIGAEGPKVLLVKTLLTISGDYTEKNFSGVYDVQTETAVKKFQARLKIVSSGTPEETGFGFFGPKTRLSLFSEAITILEQRIALLMQLKSDQTSSSTNISREPSSEKHYAKTSASTRTGEVNKPVKQIVPYFGKADPKKGPWSSYYFFGRQTQSIVTNLKGTQVADRRTQFDTNNSSELKYCKKAIDGTWSADCPNYNIEQRVIKKNCIGGNEFFWLKGYKDDRGNRFRLEVLKAEIVFDDGRIFDISDNNCNYDAAGHADGIPYALFNIVDGYRMRVWFTQLDINHKPTKLNYWEQHYARERVTNKCWQGTGPNTLWAIVQRQTAWQSPFRDRNESPLVATTGAWGLDPTHTTTGTIAPQTFTARYGGTFTAPAPTGTGTNLPWKSSNAMGKGMGWTSETEYGMTCVSNVYLNS
jgi:peptidoglycan hydrolase-like protein with peptidoglycan-binding domain